MKNLNQEYSIKVFFEEIELDLFTGAKVKDAILAFCTQVSFPQKNQIASCGKNPILSNLLKSIKNINTDDTAGSASPGSTVNGEQLHQIVRANLQNKLKNRELIIVDRLGNEVFLDGSLSENQVLKLIVLNDRNNNISI